MKGCTIQVQAFVIKTSGQQQSDAPTYSHKIIRTWYGHAEFPLLKVHSLAEIIEDKRKCFPVE